jgi:type IV pilus assembly protein PilY1
VDPTSEYVYGANLLGGVFRFDLTSSPVGVFKLGDLTDSGGRRQPVTTRPELSTIEGYRVLFIGTGRYLGTSDLKDPVTLIPPSPEAWQQTLYAFKDKDLNYGNIRSANLIQQTLSILDSTTRSTSQNSVNWTTANGWYGIQSRQPIAGSGEPRSPTVPGTLLVVTNVPSDDACSRRRQLVLSVPVRHRNVRVERSVQRRRQQADQRRHRVRWCSACRTAP